MKPTKRQKIVLVEFNNCSPFVYKLKSEKSITLKRVCDYFAETEGWSENRDSITLLDEVLTINLDRRK